MPVPMTDFAWYMTGLVTVVVVGVIGHAVAWTRRWPEWAINGFAWVAGGGALALIGASAAWVWLEANT